MNASSQKPTMLIKTCVKSTNLPLFAQNITGPTTAMTTTTTTIAVAITFRSTLKQLLHTNKQHKNKPNWQHLMRTLKFITQNTWPRHTLYIDMPCLTLTKLTPTNELFNGLASKKTQCPQPKGSSNQWSLEEQTRARSNQSTPTIPHNVQHYQKQSEERTTLLLTIGQPNTTQKWLHHNSTERHHSQNVHCQNQQHNPWERLCHRARVPLKFQFNWMRPWSGAPRSLMFNCCFIEAPTQFEEISG